MFCWKELYFAFQKSVANDEDVCDLVSVTKTLKVKLRGNFWVAITAGHVKWRPAILISLMNISAIFHQQLHHLQVSRKHRFM